MSELISVIVPVFRVEKYLHRCVDSIRRQTYKNLEIILVDDGSDDDCPAMCDALQAEDARIRVVHRENGGLSAARNSGIDIAKGKYLAFVDSDDCICPEYIAFLYRAVQETGSQIAQCHFTRFSDTPVYDQEYPTPRVYDREQMLRNLSTPGMNVCSVVAWTKLYEAELFREIRYTPGKLHEDEFTTYKVFDKAKKIAYIDAALYGYYENNASITGVRIHARRLDALEALLERYCFYQSKSYVSLLPITANHLGENLIRLSGLQKEATDPKAYAKRLESLFVKIKSTVLPCHFNRHNRLLIKLSCSAVALTQWQKAYLLAGRISGKLRLGELRRNLATQKQKMTYLLEIKRLLAHYEKNSVLLLGAIEYDNLGDHAIVYAQKKFLENIASVIEIRDELYLNVRQYLRKHIRPETVITIPGGGNMGDLWFSDEQRRRWIIEDFPNNPIVVFPQTVSYSATAEGQKRQQESVEIYNAHKNLTLCAREETSFRIMKELYPNCHVLLVPDIVLSLPVMEGNVQRKGIAVCFREDVERVLSNEERARLAHMLEGKHTFPISTIAESNVPITKREKTLQELWSLLGSAELCLTDRLHAMIFCYLTKTPCIVFDNNNHKIQRTCDDWLSDCKYISVATVETVGALLDTTISMGDPVITPAHYQQLEATIRNGQDSKAH